MAGYLVQYGRSAFVGHFSSELPVERGDPVVIRTLRGLELGSVLCEAVERFSQQVETGGELVRRAIEQDLATSQQHNNLGEQLLDRANSLARQKGLPLTFLDVEVLLDGRVAVLHGLPLAPCQADSLFEELSQIFGFRVLLLDLSKAPTLTELPSTGSGCGEPGCGSESGESSCGTSSGGCSTGSCSRGSVKSAEELSKYFKDLRSQMEAQTRRQPLN